VTADAEELRSGRRAGQQQDGNVLFHHLGFKTAFP